MKSVITFQDGTEETVENAVPCFSEDADGVFSILYFHDVRGTIVTQDIEAGIVARIEVIL